MPQTEQICFHLEQSVDEVICIANDYLSGVVYIQDDNDDSNGHQGNDINFNDSYDEPGIIDNLNI